MRLLLLFGCLLAAHSLSAQSDGDQKIAPVLRQAFAKGEKADILVVFSEKANLTPAKSLKGKAEKSLWVFQELRSVAERSQARARQILQRSLETHANSFYLVNAIAVKNCTADLAGQLVLLPEVKALALDPWIALPRPSAENAGGAQGRSGIEWGIEKINAQSVWDLGFNGQGITIGGADTGYDWVHPAIKPHYRGYHAGTDTFNHNYNWHDAISAPSPLNGNADNPCGFSITAPCDDQSHGTHTMGTMTGDDGLGNQIGVAPGASWVGCRNMERGWGQPSTYLECFEWFLAPTDTDGLHPDPLQSPHVINNSWYCAVEEGCTDLSVNELMREAVVNLKAAGVFVVVSNGNFGSGGCNTTYGPPAYFEESFSIGSIQSNDTISNFSSRGPVTIDNSGRIKPNVVAPGQWVRSCVPNNGYAVFSGTSMAGPHVAGLVALVLSANPQLIGEVETLETLIESTCMPINGLQDCSDNNGLAYPNNTYGYGRVDAMAAVQKALNLSSNTVQAGGFAPAVFPNPTQGRLYVGGGESWRGMVWWRLLDAQGREVLQRRWWLEAGQLATIELSHLQNGVYFWQMHNEAGDFSSAQLWLQR